MCEAVWAYGVRTKGDHVLTAAGRGTQAMVVLFPEKLGWEYKEVNTELPGS